MQPNSIYPTSVPNTPNQPIVSNTVPVQPVKTKKKNKFLKTLLVVALCELLIGGGIFAYFWRDSEALEQKAIDDETIFELQSQVDELNNTLQQYEMFTEQDNQDTDYSQYSESQ